MKFNENIIEFVELRIAKTLEDQDKELFTKLAKVFHEIGEKALSMTPEEFTKYLSSSEQDIVEGGIASIFDGTTGEANTKDIDFDNDALETTNWYKFLSNRMISSFIQARMIILNEVSLRKNLSSLAKGEADTKTWQAVKTLEKIVDKAKELESQIQTYSSMLIPRWDKSNHENQEHIKRVIDEKILTRLTLDLDGVHGEEKEEEEEKPTYCTVCEKELTTAIEKQFNLVCESCAGLELDKMQVEEKQALVTKLEEEPKGAE